MPKTTPKIVLYDGNCGLCSRSIRFIRKRAEEHTFEFLALQSEPGQELLQQHSLPNDLSTLVLIEDDRAYTRSTGALRICRCLRTPWPTCYGLLIWIPAPLRDAAYRLVARFRHSLFGTNDTCRLE